VLADQPPSLLSGHDCLIQGITPEHIQSMNYIVAADCPRRHSLHEPHRRLHPWSYYSNTSSLHLRGHHRVSIDWTMWIIHMVRVSRISAHSSMSPYHRPYPMKANHSPRSLRCPIGVRPPGLPLSQISNTITGRWWVRCYVPHLSTCQLPNHIMMLSWPAGQKSTLVIRPPIHNLS
jgi:hypothetical protein